MKYTPVSVDIAKHLFQVHFIDAYASEVIDKPRRHQGLLTPGTWPDWDRGLWWLTALGTRRKKLGHEVRLLQARFAKVFVMGNETT